MLLKALLLPVAASCAFALASAAQHAQVNSVAVDPSVAGRVWVCNRDNNSVSVVNTVSGSVVAEIPVGVNPRSLAFSADGSKVFVANQRGNVPVTKHFVTGFSGSDIFGSVSVINTTTLAVTQTLTNVGVEPYGVAVAPNGKYFAVSGFRSGTVKLFNATTFAQLASHEYMIDLSVIPAPFDISDVDSNKDFIADLSEPRAFTIRAASDRIYVAHNTSPYVSVLDVTLNGGGFPTAIAQSAKIDINEYPFDPFFNPTLVQTIGSQGLPRFLDDIALSPDGTRALVPHLLHNINHDVNHNFGPGLAGAFANRVYPAVTMVDLVNNSYAQPADLSARLEHELADPADPAAFVPFGPKGANTATGIATLGGTGSPLLGGSANFVVTGGVPGNLAILAYGTQTNVPLPPLGTMLVNPLISYVMVNAGPSFVRSLAVPNNLAYDGMAVPFQAAIVTIPALDIRLTNGLYAVLGTAGYGAGKMGHRAGHPGRVLYNAAGTRAVVLNRGSEDVFLYKVTGSTLELLAAFPPRHGFVERTALDNSTPMGDLPLGMALKADASTSNDDALLYVINEGNRTLSRLRIDFVAGTIVKEGNQIPTLTGSDINSLSERVGQELFEDASRAQTAGNFNNSCASCHFEGGADGNVWQRPAGPRSTMPVYGGTLGTGLVLWKGVRLSMGETGPMFGGENGGTGVFSNAEQQGLKDYHEVIPAPLSPNLDPSTNALTRQAALGSDLFFGENSTGLNPGLRTAGCGACHAKEDQFTLTPRLFTADFVDPLLLPEGGLEFNDADCFTLKENFAMGTSIRDVNSGVNVDVDGDTIPDVDRNFDGYSDLETYVPMNLDGADDFTRDDPNSYICYEIAGDPLSGLKVFERDAVLFSIPTKLGVSTTGPYMHDHVLYSLRTLLDPVAQTTDAVYGDPTLPGVQKFFNEFHDIRGHEDFVLSVSKVQLNLSSTNVQADIEAILAFIRSL